MMAFAYKGRNFGGFEAGDPKNLNNGDCNPQKAHLQVIPSLLSVYASKSVHGFGLGAFPRKKEKRKKENKKKSHTRSIFRQNSPSHGGATGYSIGTKFGRMVAPWDLITLANFKFGRLRTGCVALHESLLSFRFSALHRLSPLTQLGPARPLVINCKNQLRILNKQLRTTDLLVKNCKYKFGLPRQTQTIINVLKSTHIQILTAINSLGPNNRRSQGLARGSNAPLLPTSVTSVSR